MGRSEEECVFSPARLFSPKSFETEPLSMTQCLTLCVLCQDGEQSWTMTAALFARLDFHCRCSGLSDHPRLSAKTQTHDMAGCKFTSFLTNQTHMLHGERERTGSGTRGQGGQHTHENTGPHTPAPEHWKVKSRDLKAASELMISLISLTQQLQTQWLLSVYQNDK